MRTITLSAEWELSETDKSWLGGYLRHRFEEAAGLVQEAAVWGGNPNSVPVNAWDALHVDLELYLHASTWADLLHPDGVAGLYTPNSGIPESSFTGPKGFNVDFNPPTPIDKIEIAWDREMSEAHCLRHECAHMICRHALLPGWQGFGHGGYDHQYDPYKAMLQSKMNVAYPPGRVEYPAEWKYPS